MLDYFVGRLLPPRNDSLPRDCLGRSHLTAIPHFVFRNLRFFQTKLLQPQLAPARTKKTFKSFHKRKLKGTG